MKTFYILLIVLFLSPQLSCNKEFLDNPVQYITSWTEFKQVISSGITMVYYNVSTTGVCERFKQRVIDASKIEEVGYATFVIVEFPDGEEIFDSTGVDSCPITRIYKDNEFQTEIIGNSHVPEQLAEKIKMFK